MTTGMGYVPATVPLNLSIGQDFIHEEVHPTTTWPPGTSARIEILGGPVWSATVDGTVIRWRVESSSVLDTIAARTPYRAFLTMPRPDGLVDNWLWFKGHTRRTD